jgi:hypothetical protein
MVARRYAEATDAGRIPRVKRVVRDREGGFIALDPLGQGELVQLAPICPPLRLKRERQLRRAGRNALLVLVVLQFMLELVGLGIAWWWACSL